jgi:thiamine biosynthesis lipoprotein
MGRLLSLLLLSALLSALPVCADGAAPHSSEYRFKHPAMGGEFEFIILDVPGRGEELRLACDEAFATIDALEARVSNWKPDSITSEIMRQAGVKPVSVDEDLLAMLDFSLEIYDETSGVFDPTVQPILAVWGKYKKDGAMPSADQVKQALDLTGLKKVMVDRVAGTVYLPKPGMGLDFGGIAKGLALDQAAEVLRRHGVKVAMLSGSTSSLLAMGAPPGLEGWTVTIPHPYTGRSVAVDTVYLRDQAMGTSSSRGDQSLVIEGKRYSHIVDPRSGMPVEGVLSATVIGPRAMQCDALTKPFYILGVDEARRYCREHGEYKSILVVASGESEAQAVRVNFAPEKEQ